MGTFVTRGSGEDLRISSRDVDIESIPGVIIEKTDKEIIVLIPEQDKSLLSSVSLSRDTSFVLPSGIPNRRPSYSPEDIIPTPQPEEEENNIIVNLIDDDSISLEDTMFLDKPCNLPKFNLSFSTDFNLNDQYYFGFDNKYSSDTSGNQDNSEGSDPGIGVSEPDLGSGGSSSGGIPDGPEGGSLQPVDIGRVREITDSIINLDRNVKTEGMFDLVQKAWDISNINVLDSLVRDRLDTQLDMDFGYTITEDNFSDFAELPTYGPSEEDLSIGLAFDVVDSFTNNISPVEIGTNNQEGITLDLKLVDSAPVNSAYAGQLASIPFL